MTDRAPDQRRDQSGSRPAQTPPTSGSRADTWMGKPGSYKLRAVPIHGNQPKITVFGAAALEAARDDRLRMLGYLMNGSERVEDYATGVCYDIVAFILALDGRIDRKTLEGTGGQDWLKYFDFDSGTKWSGEAIPTGSAVGFKRIGDYEPGYFHATVAVGGTFVRGVNANGITYGWLDKADLTERLAGRRDIEVRYLTP